MYNYHYNYSYNGNMTPDQIASIFGGVFVMAMAFALIFCAIFYIFEAIGLYKMAKGRGIKNAGLAFVPVVNRYLLGGIADDVNARIGKKSGFRISLLVLSIFEAISIVLEFIVSIGVIFSAIPEMVYYDDLPERFIPQVGIIILLCVLLGMATLAAKIVSYFALYKIYCDYCGKNAAVYLVLSILFNISPFLLFAIRNRPAYSCNPQPAQAYTSPYTAPPTPTYQNYRPVNPNDPYGYNTQAAPQQNPNDPYGYNTQAAPQQNPNDPYGYNTQAAPQQNPYGYENPQQPTAAPAAPASDNEQNPKI